MDSDHIENKPFGFREKLVLATLVAGIVVIVGNESQGMVFCGTERSIPFDGTCKRFHHGLGTQ